MNKPYKNVYLFELDSVRNSSPEEIIDAHERMYDEIISKGNCIVLSLNQLTDSQAFLCLLHDEESYGHVTELFKLGVLKVANYTYLSPSQYIQSVISKDIDNIEKKEFCDIHPFIFSGLPVSPKNKDELLAIKNALIYNSFHEIEIELKNAQLSRANSQEKTSDEKRIEYIINYLKMVIDISLNMKTYITKTTDTKTFTDILSHINKISTEGKIKSKHRSIIKEAFVLLEEIKLQIPADRIQNRSSWISILSNQKNTNNTSSVVVIMAKSIVDMVYNYTVQENIANISKQYQSIEHPTFIDDFSHKLNDYFESHKALGDKFNCVEIDWHYLNENKIVVQRGLFKREKPLTKSIHWDTAYRIRNNLEVIKKKKPKIITDFVKRNWHFQVNFQFVAFFVISLVTFFLVVGFEFFVNNIFDWVQSTKNSSISMGWIISVVLDTGILLLSALLLVILQKLIDIPDLIESAKNIIKTLIDAIRVQTDHLRKIFKNNALKDTTKLYSSKEISKSKEWREYELLVNERPNLFVGNELYNIELDYKNIIRFEMEHSKKIGVIYKSSYNILVVDMVYDESGSPFAYERLISTSKEPGSVAIVEVKDKLLLLKQYRHSIRDFQYSFIRGFNEDKLNPITNVRKEIYEESGIEILPNLTADLGLIYPDTGIMNTSANVYYCKSNNLPKLQSKNEGITEIVLLSIQELETLIQSNIITDGFTLAAFAKFKSIKSKKGAQ